MSPGVIVAVVIAVIVVAIPLMIFNRLVTLRNTVQSSWHGIDVELQRRHDLVPNLVETVKGYAAHEQDVLQRVTEARTHALDAGSAAGEKVAPEQELSGALRSLFAVAEGYPDLTASRSFLELQQELANTENRLALARRIYNANVQAFNTAVQKIPNNLVAKVGDFTPAEFFRIDPVVASAPAPEAGFGSPTA